MMKRPYPELAETVKRVAQRDREGRSELLRHDRRGAQSHRRVFDEMRQRQSRDASTAAVAAELYQTYGVPPELLEQMAAEEGFTFDWAGYQNAMQVHSQVSGGEQNRLFQTGPLETLKEALRETPFIGYETTTCEAVVKGIISGDGRGDEDDGMLLPKTTAATGAERQPLRLILSQTPFYAESGGQVGDIGTISGEGFEFEVTDTQKHAGLIVHHGHLISGEVTENATCTATVNSERRDALRRAHSATHILHYALQRNVGTHAQQQGSKVDADWLRFDFSHQKALSDETLAEITRDVISQVQADESVQCQTVSLADARKAGAMMLFGEKYPDPVRMVSMGTFSRELCGGTHLDRTGQVGSFELIAEESVSAGTRRVIALTGKKAEEYRGKISEVVAQACQLLGCSAQRLSESAAALVADVRAIKKDIAAGKASSQRSGSQPTSAAPPADSPGAPSETQYAAAKAQLRDAARALNVSPLDVAARIEAMQQERARLLEDLAKATAGGELSAADLLESGEPVGDAIVVVAQTPGGNANLMRGWIDTIRKLSPSPVAVLLGTAQDDKVVLVGGLSRALVDRGLSAGTWVGTAATAVGGGGGGRPDLAQAGGKDPEKLPEALAAARDQMKAWLQ